MVVQVLYGDALVLLKAIRNQSIRLVIADPPYDNVEPERLGLGSQKGYGVGVPDLKTWMWESRRVVEEDGFLLVWEHPFHLDRVLSVAKQIGLVYRSVLVWNANNRYHFFGTGGIYSKWDACVVFSRKNKKITPDEGFATTDVFTAPVVTEGPVPGAKPLSVMKKIIGIFTKKGDWVLDPFCGSGTTARACLELGRNCVTMEIRRELKPYLDQRLLNHVKRLDQLV